MFAVILKRRYILLNAVQGAGEMLRFFCRILMFTLILTAPLSFTGEVCPDFKPACSIEEGRGSKAASVIAHRRIVTAGPDVLAAVTVENTATFPVTAVFVPACCFHNVPLHERAPPVNTPAIS